MKINKFLNKSLIIFFVFIIISTLLIAIFEKFEQDSKIIFDFSFNKYSYLSENTHKALSNINNDVFIYNLDKKDEQIQNLLTNYSKVNKKIHIQSISISENPRFASKFSKDDKNFLRNDSIVIYSEYNDKFKILNPEDFIAYGYSIEQNKYLIDGIKYEQEINRSILYVDSEINKKVYILNGHGEKSDEEIASLLDYLHVNSYQLEFIKKIDRELDNNSTIIIMAPQNDIDDNELNYIKLHEEKSGSILIAINDSYKFLNLKNFNSLLNSYGIKLKNGTVLADIKDKKSYYRETTNILPYMQSSKILDQLIESNKDILLMPGACAFEKINNLSLSPTVLLKTSKSSHIVDSENNVLETGEQILAMYSEKLNNKSKLSRLIVLGNADVITNKYISSITFANDFTQALFNALMPEKIIDLEFAIKPAFRQELLPISKVTGVCIIIMIPLIILLLALYVINKRKTL